MTFSASRSGSGRPKGARRKRSEALREDIEASGFTPAELLIDGRGDLRLSLAGCFTNINKIKDLAEKRLAS